jgi:putative ABC transport system permease protein
MMIGLIKSLHFYNFHINSHDLVLLGSLFVAGTFILLLWFGISINQAANRILALALVSVILQMFWVVGPLIYLYSLKITRPKYKFHRKDMLLLTPLLLWNFSLFIYLYLSHRLIKQFYQQQKFEGGDRDRHELRWLDYQIVGFGILWLFWIAGMDLMVGVMTVCVATAAFSRREADPNVRDLSGELREKGIWLKKTVKANLYYQDSELTLSSLAEKLDLHPHELSRIINKSLKKNFPDFVNELRVAEVIRKMKDKANDRLTLLGIAYDAGFNSKTSFNRAFKQMSGKSPTEFKKPLENQRPTYNLGRYARPELLILKLEPPPRRVHQNINNRYMFRNYVKIAWRNLTRHKMYSGINVLGLAVGMAITILISLWIWDEVSFDKSFANHQQIAQIMTTSAGDDGTMITDPRVCQPIAAELRSKYGSDFKNISLSRWNMSAFTVGNKTISDVGLWVEDRFPTMLSLDMLKGNINALTDPSSIIINASLAKTLFGDGDAIGKMIRLDNNESYKVAGVFRDFPNGNPISGNSNSWPTLQDANYFLPWKKYITREQWVKDAAMDWNNRSWQCYVQLNDNVDMDKEREKIKNVVMAHKNAKTDGVESAYLYPMDKWHLYSDFKNGKPVGTRLQFVWLFAMIGVFVLLLACINFMNLSTARSEKRAKEVGIRKTVGSLRTQLIKQFLSESVLVAFVSFVLCIILVVLLLPFFNSLAAKHTQMPLLNPVFWICALAFTFITGLLAGSYPALYLSKFDPIKVLKGTFRVGKNASLPRKVLVVLQFSFSIALIIGTIIVFKQIQFAKSKPINYKKEGLISVSGVTQDLPRFYDAVRNDLLATGVVDDMSGASDATTNLGAWRNGFNWEGKNPNTSPMFGFMLMTEDFGKTIGWQLMEGRDFSKEFATDSLAMILNESAVRQIGMKKDIVGENIQWDGKNYHVIGVVKDIIQESPYSPVTPMVYLLSHTYIGAVTVAIKTGLPVKNALAKIEKAFKKYNPGLPFNYTFIDEDYARKFADEKRIGNLATFFTILAIFISCLGLFGLASFVAEQRKKEIGVRKVLGASTYNLWQMLSKEFAMLVIISCFVAVPLAWYYSHNWLQQYKYKTTIPAWVFFASGLGALVITLIIVSFQSIKAAFANPVKSLRSE